MLPSVNRFISNVSTMGDMEQLRQLVAELKDILKEEYGPKVTQVGEVLFQFGPDRFKKPSE